ncbi:unnamed protein product, partial [Phaeothamnion confervicola]
VQRGAYCFGIGSPKANCDWLYVDNLVRAAFVNLRVFGSCSGGPPISSGQAYFINDGQPLNNFTFLDLIIAGLGEQTG